MLTIFIAVFFYGSKTLAHDMNQYFKETPNLSGISFIESLIEVTSSNPFDDKSTRLCLIWKMSNLRELAKDNKKYLGLYHRAVDKKCLQKLE
ncbi:MAG: hypothetical protein ACJAYG_002850 [Oceanicoccus sp.]|jgi:hypothetical protein